MEKKDRVLLEEVDSLFRTLVRRFVKERDKVSIEGISLPGMLILNSILRDGERRLGELAEQLDFTSGAITALCDKLEAGGYAVRKRSPEDRRSVVLDITEKGKELLARTRGTGSYMIDKLFGSFTREELEAQSKFYSKLIEQLDGFAEEVARHVQEEAVVLVPPKRAERPARNNPFISY
jgi:DNA-binding MarR family transcriptional regulator